MTLTECYCNDFALWGHYYPNESDSTLVLYAPLSLYGEILMQWLRKVKAVLGKSAAFALILCFVSNFRINIYMCLSSAELLE